MKIYVIGHPTSHGGANTELWHTLKLWRRYGVEVTVVPTWSTNKEQRQQLAEIGCKILPLRPRNPNTFYLPDDSLVVSFCSPSFVDLSRQIRNCRLIYVRCMCYWDDPLDRQTIDRDGPFDAYVCQSHYQRQQLWPRLEAAGVTEERCPVIRGAFDTSEFPFLPSSHHNGDPFVIGRLSRRDPRKYPLKFWDIYAQMCPPVRARVMGWGPEVEKHIGRPPEWAETLGQCAERSEDFIRSLHCMVHPVGEYMAENWPRVVLEAMACGVPVVTDRRGGTCEMIKHGRTGYLCGDPAEFAEYTLAMAENESLRLEIASRARTELEEELADPEIIWTAWKQLFTMLA